MRLFIYYGLVFPTDLPFLPFRPLSLLLSVFHSICIARFVATHAPSTRAASSMMIMMTVVRNCERRLTAGEPALQH